MGPMVHGIPALVTWVMGGPWALAAPVIVLDPYYRIIRVRLSVPDSSNCTVPGSFIKILLIMEFYTSTQSFFETK
jgi:hypothetical protein